MLQKLLDRVGNRVGAYEKLGAPIPAALGDQECEGHLAIDPLDRETVVSSSTDALYR